MIQIFPRVIIHGETAVVISSKVEFDYLLPKRLVVPKIVEPWMLIEGVTITGLDGKEKWGPWFPQGNSVPAELFYPMSDIDLGFEMEYVEKGSFLNVHVRNPNPATRYFSCAFDVLKTR